MAARLSADEKRAWYGMVTLALVVIPEVERACREYGLVHVEYGLLAGLRGQPDGVRLTDLAEAMRVSPSRLSHRVRKLIDLGYVELRGCSGDARVRYAVITDAGRMLVDRIAPIHAAAVRRMVFDHLDPGQTKALADALDTISLGLGISCLEPDETPS
jgi:DNA-binding MarR family transcriptional regulator